MNCKPGDLAVIFRTSSGEESCIGHFCTIIDFFPHPIDGAPGWRFTPPVRCGRVWYDATLDQNLRPIRDPGDDAVDETLVGNPVPAREEMSA